MPNLRNNTRQRAPKASKSKLPQSVSQLAEPAPNPWPKKAPLNTVIAGDCVEQLNKLPADSVDLVFADPPFNIGYKYDVYEDRKQTSEYLQWSRDWMTAVYRALKPDGTFWLAIGDDYAAELKVLAREIGFYPRSWVIWYYTFGVNCKNKFTRSHTHLFYFTKDLKSFTFMAGDLANRIPSARQLVYNDSRGNPDGRLSDDTWILRPQDAQSSFSPDEDTWYIPRVNGTFKERQGFHGCQMPEQLLARIIRHCSQSNDLVVDPFSGSATTVVVAKKLGRRYLGIDLSKDYVKHGLARLENTVVGEPLEGSAEPTISALKTPTSSETKAKLPLRTTRQSNSETIATATKKAALHRPVFEPSDEYLAQLIELFEATRQGHSLDHLVADPELSTSFVNACQQAGLPGEPRDWNQHLLGLRKRGRLSHLPTTQRTGIGWDQCDDNLFATEFALREMIDQQQYSLDQILGDPELAARFDSTTKQYIPFQFSPLLNRWTALKLRKEASSLKLLAQAKQRRSLPEFHDTAELMINTAVQLPEQPGLYQLIDNSTKSPSVLYVGVTKNLRRRFSIQFVKSQMGFYGAKVNYRVMSYQLQSFKELLVAQAALIQQLQPAMNFKIWVS